MTANFDFSELAELTRDLGTVEPRVRVGVRKAVEITARHIKDEWRDALRGSQSLPALPAAINYDIDDKGTTVDAEIGFDLSKSQGALGFITEFGALATAPRGYGRAALQKWSPDFEKGILLAGAEAIEKTL